MAEYACGVVTIYRPPLFIPPLLSELYCKVRCNLAVIWARAVTIFMLTLLLRKQITTVITAWQIILPFLFFFLSVRVLRVHVWDSQVYRPKCYQRASNTHKMLYLQFCQNFVFSILTWSSAAMSFCFDTCRPSLLEIRDNVHVGQSWQKNKMSYLKQKSKILLLQPN